MVFTNSQGMVSGYVPINTTFNAEFNLPGCLNTYFPITTFSTQTSTLNLGNVIVNFNSLNINITPIELELKDCSSTNNVAGFVTIKNAAFQTIMYGATDPNGHFFATTSCINNNSILNIYGNSYSPSRFGNTSGTFQANVLNSFGNISLCPYTPPEYVNYTINTGQGAKTNIINSTTGGTFTQSYNNGITTISGTANGKFIEFSFDGGTSTGTSHNLVSYKDQNSTATSWSLNSLNITQYANVGGRIYGIFNGTIFGPNYNAVTISCNFSVTRSQ